MAFNNDFNYFSDIPIDLTTPKPIVKRRSSFFNIAAKEEVEKSVEKTEYMEKLKKEQLEWKNLFHVTVERARQIQKQIDGKVSYGSSILSQERKDYLEHGINVKEYLKQTEDFTKRVLFYVKEKEMLQKRLKFCQEQLQDKVIESTIKNLSL